MDDKLWVKLTCTVSLSNASWCHIYLLRDLRTGVVVVICFRLLDRKYARAKIVHQENKNSGGLPFVYRCFLWRRFLFLSVEADSPEGASLSLPLELCVGAVVKWPCIVTKLLAILELPVLILGDMARACLVGLYSCMHCWNLQSAAFSVDKFTDSSASGQCGEAACYRSSDTGGAGDHRDLRSSASLQQQPLQITGYGRQRQRSPGRHKWPACVRELCFRYAQCGSLELWKKAFLKHFRNHTWCWCGQLTVHISFCALVFLGPALKLPSFGILCTGKKADVLYSSRGSYRLFYLCMPQILCCSSACAVHAFPAFVSEIVMQG